jgi:hypothetical protein
MRYFRLSGSNQKSAAVAKVADDFDDYSFWDDLEVRRSSEGWQAISSTLVPWQESEGDPMPSDLLSSDLLPRLCSPNLRNILSPLSEELVWLPVSVTRGAKYFDYFILHFATFPDVLDESKTEYAGGRVLRPHLDAAKLGGRQILALDPLSPSWLVSETARQSIEEAGCSGIEFEPIPAT